MTIRLADGLEVSGHGAIIGKTGYGSTTVGVHAAKTHDGPIAFIAGGMERAFAADSQWAWAEVEVRADRALELLETRLQPGLLVVVDEVEFAGYTDQLSAMLTRYQEADASVLFTGNLGNVPRPEVLAALPWRVALTCDLPQQSIELIGTPVACQMDPGQAILVFNGDGERELFTTGLFQG